MSITSNNWRTPASRNWLWSTKHQTKTIPSRSNYRSTAPGRTAGAPSLFLKLGLMLKLNSGQQQSLQGRPEEEKGVMKEKTGRPRTGRETQKLMTSVLEGWWFKSCKDSTNLPMLSQLSTTDMFVYSLPSVQNSVKPLFDHGRFVVLQVLYQEVSVLS